MRVGSSKSGSRAPLASFPSAVRSPRGRSDRALGLCLLASSACSLDFDVGDREFECPPQVKECLVCNADGTCRQALQSIQAPPAPQPGGPPAASPAESPPESPPESALMPAPPSELPVVTTPLTPVGVDPGPLTPGPGIDVTTPDAASPPAPDAGAVEVCAEFRSRASDSLCLSDGEQCFTLGSVLSPALTAWLDPTTLPRDGSRYWCDRSGQRHHALLVPDGSEAVVSADGRAVSDTLARSFQLDDGWLSLSEGSQPALAPGNFAVVVAAAARLDASGGRDFELFESGALSRINLSLVPGTGQAEGKISSQETVLVAAPVLTRSSVYDGSFHLYSLYRRSEVRVLDDVLQLRLNGVLEFRGSSIAIPRALDLSSVTPPRIGGKTASSGAVVGSRGRVAALVVLRGSVPEDELARLENFLCAALDVCAAPEPLPGTAPPRALDAGPEGP
jgi:hypothetical protein